MGKMTAHIQIHAKNGISGLAKSQVDTEISLGAAVSLHIGILGAEQLTGALTREEQMVEKMRRTRATISLLF